MNNNHRPESEELDAFLSACQRGEQPGSTVASNPELLALADKIRTLTEAVQPDPAFAAALEQSLQRAASRQLGAARPVIPKRSPKMFRRIAFSLVSLAVLVLVVLAISTRLQGDRPPASPLALQPLPRLGGTSPYNKGGGAEMLGAAPNYLLPTILSSPNFSGTEFILATELPAAPASLTVYRQAQATPLTVESFRRLAERFGVQGPVYTQKVRLLYETHLLEAPALETTPEAPSFYVIFDGMRQVSGDSSWGGVTYTDHSVLPANRSSDLLPFEQQAAIAEAFLKERGLLDFPYRPVADPYLPGYVRFTRFLGDYALEDSEIEVQFGAGGQIQSISYHPLPIEAIADYPLRSAQSAWDDLLANRLSWEQMSFWTYGHPVDQFVYQSWQPQYHPGENVEILGFIMVYEPLAAQQAALRLTISDLLELAAAESDIQTLSTLTDRQVKVWGQVRQAENGALILDVAGWGETTEYAQYFTGSLTRQGEAFVFTRDDGQSFYLPHTPANLPEGVPIEISAWESGRQENGLPVLEWDFIQVPPVEQGSDAVYRGSGMTPGSASGWVGVSNEMSATIPVEPAPSVPDAPWNPPSWGPGKAVEALEGQLFATVFENPDGTRQYNFSLAEMPLQGDGWSLSLETADPEGLAALDRQWVRVWGRYQQLDWPVLDVERFEAVNAAGAVQAWLGHIAIETIEGRQVAVLTSRDGQRLVLAWTLRYADFQIEPGGHQFIIEGVLRPETFGGLPLIEEISSISGEEIDALTDLSQYTLTPRPEVIKNTPPPPLLPGKATVDDVKLAYMVVYAYDEATQTTTASVQPVWRFSGYSEDGTRFVILIQAVEQAYLK